MRIVNHSAASRREFPAAHRIPYAAHVAPHVVRTSFGDYLQSFRLGGASFETNDDDELNNWHERLNVLWRNIAGPGVALWTHVIRRRASLRGGHADPAAVRGRSFADRLQTRYQRRMAGETLMLNEVYLSVIHRPAVGLATGLVSRVLTRAQRDGTR
ncbi:MAG: conjugal transfer protein TrbE, partial [Gammaproteobacteria bacterium]|nr:conjugal transfer protein TrbE [Gammaproteobacteria bacterium]